jgi:GntR family transcriptional repressor for pyruvate dehydrogenase complex
MAQFSDFQSHPYDGCPDQAHALHYAEQEWDDTLMELKPIKLKRISDQVFEQLRESIFRGEIKPGQQLMPERELAQALQVSRSSVRDAINKLVTLGLLEQRQGQGTFVQSPDSRSENPLAAAMETEDASIRDLLEVRMGLECNAAALAAIRANGTDVLFLEKSIQEMRDETESGRLGTEADVAFHMAIAYATKNPVQVSLMRNFYNFLFAGINKNLVHLYEKRDNIKIILKQHHAISECIRTHNPDAAFKAMQRHITFVIDFYRTR